MIFVEIDKKAFSYLPFGLNTICDGTRQANISRPEGFNYHQILWVIEGKGVCKIGNDSFTISKNEGFFVRADTPHSYSGDNFFTAWCSFTLSTELLDYMGIEDYLRFTIPNNFNEETQQLLRFANGNSTPLTRSSAGYTYILDFFSRVLSSSETVSRQVQGILEKRYSEPITLNDISEELCIDKFSICRIYKREQGTTIMEDLKNVRIKKAKQLLKYNVASIEEIGRMCGFESSSYFVKRFRETVGITPSEYRKKHT